LIPFGRGEGGWFSPGMERSVSKTEFGAGKEKGGGWLSREEKESVGPEGHRTFIFGKKGGERHDVGGTGATFEKGASGAVLSKRAGCCNDWEKKKGEFVLPVKKRPNLFRGIARFGQGGGGHRSGGKERERGDAITRRGIK